MVDQKKEKEQDYTLSNPDTLTKYKTAGQIAEKVLAAVTELCVPGEKVVDICEKGDALIEEEIGKVYRGKNVVKGFAHPATVSGTSLVTPYTPLRTDKDEAAVELREGEPVKIQLGAQIDGFGAIVCDTILARPKDKIGDVVTGREADLMLATHYANEVLLRLMIPPGLIASGTDEERAKATAVKPPTQSKITSILEKVVKSYDCSLIESTTSWLFGHEQIEGSKKIVLAPAEGAKGEGVPAAQEVWGVEMGVSLGSGKVKVLEQRPTLHRRTSQTYLLKRPMPRKFFSEVKKRFGKFPFSLRQLDDNPEVKSGLASCIHENLVRQYEVLGDKDGSQVARLLTTIAITKNGITKLGGPPAWDLSKFQTDKKITDEEILKILEQPLARNTGKKKGNKKKKAAKKSEVAGDDEPVGDEDESEKETE